MNAKDLAACGSSLAIVYVLRLPCQQVITQQGAEFQATLHMEKVLVDSVLKRYQHASLPTFTQAQKPLMPGCCYIVVCVRQLYTD